MYLHVGNNQSVRIKNVIGIFDADSATVSQITRKYLSKEEGKKNVKFASMELPKSFVLYEEGKETYKICFSQLSSASLAGRIESGISTDGGNKEKS